jgi:hypothetical protein
MPKYSDFQKLIVNLGPRAVGQKFSGSSMLGEHATPETTSQYLIKAMNISIEGHICKLCDKFAKRWINKSAPTYTYRVTLGLERFPPTSIITQISICNNAFKWYISNTTDLEQLVRRKPGAGNFKNKPKPGNPSVQTNVSEDTEAWDLDI